MTFQKLVLSCVLAAVAFSNKSSNAADESPTILREIEYSRPDGISLTLDLYRPADSRENLPVVVFVHGGGWKNGSKKSAAKTAAWLAEHGFAIVSINYRLTDSAMAGADR